MSHDAFPGSFDTPGPAAPSRLQAALELLSVLAAVLAFGGIVATSVGIGVRFGVSAGMQAAWDADRIENPGWYE